MDVLTYLKRANTISQEDSSAFSGQVSINLITNFTDDVLRKLLTGICLSNQIFPDIYVAPYQQYAMELKNPASGLALHPADITFVCFDVNPYVSSPFRLSIEHAEEVFDDLERWSASQNGLVVISTLPIPYRNAYGNLFESEPLYGQIRRLNERLIERAAANPRIHVCDINRILHAYGESRARDLRHLYASDIPFTAEFSLKLCQEWFAYIRLMQGNVKKCIVLDLDQTLWGGVLGEEGPLGITLGPGYPGKAFQEFQRALLSYYERGILLAINSRNNLTDVQAVFDQNPHMILKPSHFAAMAVNWNDKAENLVTIAAELNIGVGSLVFFDDDAMNRALVRHALPDVLVPELAVPPEEYVPILYGLHELNQLSLTDEDLSRSRMAAEERERKQVQSVTRSVEEYIAALDLKVKIQRNPADKIARLAQLTQKTNQFNLTTLRLNEADIERFIAIDGFVFSGDIVDRYGAYGTTILAMFEKTGAGIAQLRIFLMSCRVMGRGVEMVFLDALIQIVKREGISEIHAEFIPSAKNPPSKDFLSTMGFQFAGEGEHGSILYRLILADYQTDSKLVQSTIHLSYE